MKTLDKDSMDKSGSPYAPGERHPLTHAQRDRASELYVMQESSNRGCPEFWADLAHDAECLGSVAPKYYKLAAELWDRAYGVTMGHNRAARYEASAKRCRALVPADV